MQDEDGQTVESESISAGLDYPGVGPEHSYLHDIGRVTYEPITDSEAMDAFSLLCRTEGIIPAIESSHALAGAIKVGQRLAAEGGDPHEKIIIVNLSGRGDKDVQTAAEWFGMLDENGQVKGTTLSTRRPKGFMPHGGQDAAAGEDDTEEGIA
jgi:tryptophan synthase beta chain